MDAIGAMDAAAPESIKDDAALRYVLHFSESDLCYYFAASYGLSRGFNIIN